MTADLIPNSDLQVFAPADIARARLIMNQPNLDEASAIRALIIQRDTGLSMARGEISIVLFNGRPTVMINRQGYLAYASRQPGYDGYESGIDTTADGELAAWCRVYNKERSHPVSVRIYQKEYAKQTQVWKEKPRYMLEKTAISLALRAAFPVLNGTYTEDEIEADVPVRIDPKPTDIRIQPEPAGNVSNVRSPAEAVPVPDPAVHRKDCQTCTVEEVKFRYLPIYRSQHLETGVFTAADLGNGKYDKDMIIADYQKQAGISRPAPAASAGESGQQNASEEAQKDAANPPAVKPAATLSGKTCEVCGSRLLDADVTLSAKYCDGHLFCESHRFAYLQKKLEAKNGGGK